MSFRSTKHLHLQRENLTINHKKVEYGVRVGIGNIFYDFRMEAIVQLKKYVHFMMMVKYTGEKYYDDDISYDDAKENLCVNPDNSCPRCWQHLFCIATFMSITCILHRPRVCGFEMCAYIVGVEVLVLYIHTNGVTILLKSTNDFIYAYRLPVHIFCFYAFLKLCTLKITYNI